jgi:hypothetical protein
MALRCPLWYALQFLSTLTQSQMLCEFVEQRMHRAFCFRAKYIRRLSAAVGHRAQRVPQGTLGAVSALTRSPTDCRAALRPEVRAGRHWATVLPRMPAALLYRVLNVVAVCCSDVPQVTV